MAVSMDWLSRDKITRHWMWGVPLIFGIIILDQLSKALVLNSANLRALDCLGEGVPCGAIKLSSLFNVTMMWNPGVSFGFLQAVGLGRWLLFLVIGVIATGFTFWMFRAERRMTAIALAMVVGGAVGNLIDRARFGAVVDFLDFSGPWFGLKIAGWDVGFPWIFNVADASITIGAAALLLDQLLVSRKRAS